MSMTPREVSVLALLAQKDSDEVVDLDEFGLSDRARKAAQALVRDKDDRAKRRMDGIRERSGKVESDDPLVSFLYQLMRDHLALGIVESLMADAERQPSLFTNGWLANYAKDMAERLRRKG
jgi:hypothetical protein